MEIKRYYQVKTEENFYIKCHLVDESKKRTLLFQTGYNVVPKFIEIPRCLYEVWLRSNPLRQGTSRRYIFAGIRMGFLKNLNDDHVWDIIGLSHVDNFRFVCLGDARFLIRESTIESLCNSAINMLWSTYFVPDIISVAAGETTYKFDQYESERGWPCNPISQEEILKNGY